MVHDEIEDKMQKTFINIPIDDEKVHADDFIEACRNGKPINWSYWSSLTNISSKKAAKLAYHIDPIDWPSDSDAEGPWSDQLRSDVVHLEQNLKDQSESWNLTTLVSALIDLGHTVPNRMRTEMSVRKDNSSSEQTNNNYFDAEEPRPEELRKAVVQLQQNLKDQSESLNLGTLEHPLTDSGNIVPEGMKTAMGVTRDNTSNVLQVNNNEMEYSGLLNAPKLKDEWFEIIDAMTREFYDENKIMPTKAQAWTRLRTKPPANYGVLNSTYNNFECIKIINSSSHLTQRAFYQRWNTYTFT
jgi:hypothetical protein